MNSFVNPFGFNTTPWINSIPGFIPGMTTGFNGWNSLNSGVPFNGFGWNNPVSNGWNTGGNFGGFGFNGLQNTTPFGGFNAGWNTPSFNTPGFNTPGFNFNNTPWNTTGYNTNPMWNFGGYNGFAKNTVNPGFIGGPTPFNGWNNTTTGGFNTGLNTGFNTPWNFGGAPFNFNGFANTPWGYNTVPFGFNTNAWNGAIPGAFGPGAIPSFWQNTPYGVTPTGIPNTTPGFNGGYPQGVTPGAPVNGVNGAYPGGLNSNLCREAA